MNIGGELDEIYHSASPASPKDFSRIPFPILKVGALGANNSSGLVLAKGARLMLASSSKVYGNPIVNPRGRTIGATLTQWECAAFMMRPSATPRR
jgi:dTDP-glucose 4,6-dehydratase